MNKRDELISKLSAMRKEFEGFPEEQKVFDDAVQELAKPSIPSLDETVRATDILLMAKTLGAYCRGRSCDECVFNERLSCTGGSSWFRDINDELLAKHEGEEVTFYHDEEEK